MACLPCLAPLGIALGGGVGILSQKKDDTKEDRKKLILYFVSLFLLIISNFILIYFLFIKKTPCKTCIPWR